MVFVYSAALLLFPNATNASVSWTKAFGSSDNAHNAILSREGAIDNDITNEFFYAHWLELVEDDNNEENRDGSGHQNHSLKSDFHKSPHTSSTELYHLPRKSFLGGRYILFTALPIFILFRVLRL